MKLDGKLPASGHITEIDWERFLPLVSAISTLPRRGEFKYGLLYDSCISGPVEVFEHQLLDSPNSAGLGICFKLEVALEASLKDVSRGSVFEGVRIFAILIHIVAPGADVAIFAAVAKLHIFWCLTPCF